MMARRDALELSTSGDSMDAGAGGTNAPSISTTEKRCRASQSLWVVLDDDWGGRYRWCYAGLRKRARADALTTILRTRPADHGISSDPGRRLRRQTLLTSAIFTLHPTGGIGDSVSVGSSVPNPIFVGSWSDHGVFEAPDRQMDLDFSSRRMQPEETRPALGPAVPVVVRPQLFFFGHADVACVGVHAHSTREPENSACSLSTNRPIRGRP